MFSDMEISFANANPHQGGESVLLYFDRGDSRTNCILIDSGTGVDVGDMLGANETLSAILLTHAHADHYLTIADNHVDGVPVLTAPDTARILPEVLRPDRSQFADASGLEGVLDDVQRVDGWHDLFPGVEVRAVPAGHALGAAGFVVRVTDGGEKHHMLFTGDFTLRPVAGNLGLSTELPAQIDTLFFNAVVDERGIDSPTESLCAIVDGVIGGGRVLVATDGLEGLHYTHLIDRLNEAIDLDASVALAGHLAKLYERLGMDRDCVTAITEFDDCETVIGAGEVIIAGPATVEGGSAGRLAAALPEDATCIDVGRHGPLADTHHRFESFEYTAHPPRDRAERIVDELVPRQLVINHGNRDRYNDIFDFTLTWGNTDSQRQILYEGGEWQAPYWVNDDTVEYIERNRQRQLREERGTDSTLADVADMSITAWPECDRLPTSLDEEGVDIERVRPGGERGEADAGHVKNASCKYDVGEDENESGDAETVAASATEDGTDADGGAVADADTGTATGTSAATATATSESANAVSVASPPPTDSGTADVSEDAESGDAAGSQDADADGGGSESGGKRADTAVADPLDEDARERSDGESEVAGGRQDAERRELTREAFEAGREEEAMRELLDRVRRDEDGGRAFASAPARVIDASESDYLLRVDRDALGLDLEHRETVTAGVETAATE